METEVHTGPGDSNVTVEYLRAYYKQESKKYHDESERKQDAFRRDIAALNVRCETLDALLAEYLRLKVSILERCRKSSSSQSRTRSEPSPRDQAPTLRQSEGSVNRNGIRELLKDEPLIPVSHFRALQKKCEDYARKLQAANDIGQKYKKRCEEYHEQRKRDRAAIKTWQEYHDKLIAMKEEAKRRVSASSSKAITDSPTRSGVTIQSLKVGVSHPSEKQKEADRPTSTNLDCVRLREGRTESRDAEQYCSESRSTPKQLLNPAAPLPTHRAVQQGLEPWSLEKRVTDTMVKIEAGMWKPLPHYSQRIIGSSQSTEGELETTKNPPKSEPLLEDDDIPEIISSRSIRKPRASKRRYADLVEAHQSVPGHALNTSMIRIKDEGGSSPMDGAAFISVGYQESIDLDDISGHYTTPRKNKHQKIYRQGQLSPIVGKQKRDLRYERSQSLPDDLQSRSTQLSNATRTPPGAEAERIVLEHPEPLRSLDINRPLMLPRTGNRPLKKRQRSGGGDITELAEDGDVYIPSPASSVQHVASVYVSTERILDPKPRRLNMLLETPSVSSPTRQMLSPALGSRSESPRKRNKQHAQPQKPIATFGSRADNLYPDEIEGRQAAECTPTNVAASGQACGQASNILGLVKQGQLKDSAMDLEDSLQQLVDLDGSWPYKPRPNFVTPKQPPNFGQMFKVPKSVSAPPRASKLSGHTASTMESPACAKTDGLRAARLRSLPFEGLTLDDFKINVSANHGLDYAFTDVVRNREARLCLPGCTRPECCGDHFRKMAAIGGAPAPRRGLWEASSSQEDPDDRLLREYLGNNAPVLASMTPQQREDALLKAKAAQLAGSFGRHRAQWQRSRTPPGYWRTDFPTTQELDEDRTEARKREREELEERYREAMKRNGRWRFADE